MSVKKILWPTDFSKNAEVALPYVNSLINKYQPEVHVLYVIDDLGNHEPWYGEFEELRVEKIHKWAWEKAQNRLNRICDTYLNGCPMFYKHTAIGDPAQEILKAVHEYDIDLVVMASRGSQDHFMFGSVAEKVIKNASVPVVTIPVVRSRAESGSDDEQQSPAPAMA